MSGASWTKLRLPASSMVNFESLINQQTSHSDSGLLIIDENINPYDLHARPGWYALTNRFDQQTQLQSRGWSCTLSDFSWPEALQVDHLIYRISKEKAVVNHLINLAGQHLTEGARITLFGDKSEGIKSYAKNAQKYLGGERLEKKLGGDSWMVELSLGSSIGAVLNDQEYTQLRVVATVGTESLYSKPGVYGWQKIDKGSQQLIQRLPAMLGADLPISDLSVLDLGSGSGYLSLAACGPESQITATDNNVAAMQATLHSLQQAGMKAQFQLSNAGEELDGRFDIILCNPPFHSGFGIDYDLTDRFSKSAARLLKRDGKACFVVNQHVPLKRIASNYFNSVELDLDTSSFCTYLLTQPKI